MTNPWLDPDVAVKQRALIDRQLTRWDDYPHFVAFEEALRLTECPGSILEVGCGVGHGREILDRAGVGYASYTGVDISPTALALAKERYPESGWYLPGDLPVRGMVSVEEKTATKDVMTFTVRTHGAWDVVIDGACVMHVDNWRGHLATLCAASRRFVILHRLPISGLRGGREDTFCTETSGYGQTFPAWSFGASDVAAEMERHGFVQVSARSADGDSKTWTFAKPRHWATYCDRNYLSRLKALYASMVRHCGPFKLHVLCWDDEVLDWAHDEVGQLAEGQHIDGFLENHPELDIGKLPGPHRTLVEHMWTCGPQWIADVMRQTGEPVTYVDADIMFHSSPEPVFAEIDDAPWALFPHNFAPASAGLPGPTRETHEVFGKFNVGLLYAADVSPILHWAQLCREWCYDRLEAFEDTSTSVGLRYGDQKFLEVVQSDGYGPRPFPWRRAHVVRHPGAELGPWAVHTHALDVRDGVIHFGNRPLVAYHYSALKMLPGGEDVNTRPEYQLTQRQADIIYSPYWGALMEALK